MDKIVLGRPYFTILSNGIGKNNIGHIKWFEEDMDIK